MQSIIEISTRTYWIAGDGQTVLRFGVAQPGQVVTTGQPALYTTEVRDQWLEQLLPRGIQLDEDGNPVGLDGVPVVG